MAMFSNESSGALQGMNCSTIFGVLGLSIPRSRHLALFGVCANMKSCLRQNPSAIDYIALGLREVYFLWFLAVIERRVVSFEFICTRCDIITTCWAVLVVRIATLNTSVLSSVANVVAEKRIGIICHDRSSCDCSRESDQHSKAYWALCCDFCKSMSSRCTLESWLGASDVRLRMCERCVGRHLRLDVAVRMRRRSHACHRRAQRIIGRS